MFFQIDIFPPSWSHLEGFSVLALSSPLSEKSLLFLFLLLLLQRPDMLLKTDESVLFVHICEQITTLSAGRAQIIYTKHWTKLTHLYNLFQTKMGAIVLCSSSSSANVGLSSRYCWASDQVVRYVTLAMLSKMFFRASQFLFLSCLACSWKWRKTRMWKGPDRNFKSEH